MTLVVVTPPAASLVSLAAAKQHLRVDVDDTGQDDVIARCIATAVAELDAPDGWLGRALGDQVLELRTGGFGLNVCDSLFGALDAGVAAGWGYSDIYDFGLLLPCPPVREILAVSYRGSDGTLLTLDAAAYRLYDRLLLPTDGRLWPPVAAAPDAVTVRYKAGYVGDDLPAPIASAILLKAGALYETRETSAAIAASTADALLATYRVYA